VNSIVYNYKHGFSGFAAMLNESQAQILSGNGLLYFCIKWIQVTKLTLNIHNLFCR
jgi:Peptidase inhibitor I9